MGPIDTTHESQVIVLVFGAFFWYISHCHAVINRFSGYVQVLIQVYLKGFSGDAQH